MILRSIAIIIIMVLLWFCGLALDVLRNDSAIKRTHGLLVVTGVMDIFVCAYVLRGIITYICSRIFGITAPYIIYLKIHLVI